MHIAEASTVLLASAVISGVIGLLSASIVTGSRRERTNTSRSEMIYPHVLWLKDHDQAEYVCDCQPPGTMKIYRMKLRAKFGV